jgi:peptidoglycan-N-acetylglucosamine deacetylase
MDEGATGLQNGSAGPPASAPGSGPASPPRIALRRSDEPHHRRRRLSALALLASLAFVVGIAAGSGGGGGASHHAAAQGTGFLARVQVLAGTGPGSLAAVEQSAESAAISRTLAYTPYVRIAGSQHRELALTFDDGPGPFTPEVLSVLERTNTPATFFEVGTLERYFHVSTSRIVGDGYPIGDHTELHAPMSHLSAKLQEQEILEQTSQIGAFGAPFPRMFRPPYGLWNRTTLKLLRKYRMLMVMWTVDTSDYRQPGVEAIVHSAVSGARPGAIILMHDAGGIRSETVEALPTIIKDLRARGYQLVTVPKLLLDNPAPGNQQISSIAGGGG